MKRILMLNYEFPPLGGGGGVAAYKLAKALVKEGNYVDYVTTWFPGLKKYEVVEGINIYRVKVLGRKELPTATTLSLVTYPLFSLILTTKLCKKNKYDVINTQFAIPTGPLGLYLSKKYKIKNILSLHGGDVYDPTKSSSPHKKWYLKRIVKFVLKNSDIIVTTSSDVKHKVMNFYKPEKYIEIIPLPYKPYKYRKLKRKKLKLRDSNTYIVSVGRLVKRKGFDFLINSFTKLDPKYHLIIIGNGPERNTLIALSKKLNLRSRVHMVGAVSEEKKYQYLNVSDIYVLSSIHEGFGIVLQEAMQVGLPLVVTSEGGHRDFVKDGVNGYVVRYGDKTNLASKIRKITENKELYSLMSMNNKKAIIKFDDRMIAKQYLKLMKN